MSEDMNVPATRQDVIDLAARLERAENTILRAIREMGRSHKGRLDSTEQRLSDLEQRVLELETGK